MRLAETNLTDTSKCHPGLSPDPFSNRNLTAMESELLTFLASWTPPKLAVSKYDAFISVLASAGVTLILLLLVLRCACFK